MAKKRNRDNKPNDFVTVEASVKRLQSLLTAPPMSQFVQSGNLQGVREKLVRINFMTIRNVVDRIPLLNAIINAQTDHIRQYCAFAQEDTQPGFKFIKSNGEEVTENDTEQIKALTEFVEQTGFEYDDDREDDLSDYAAMFTRETLTIDQIATELQRNRKGEVCGFWLLDGSTIKRVNQDDKKFSRNIRYVQQIENKIFNEYTADNLIFDYKNLRADLRFRGWGYSITEQCIDLITTLLFGYNYVRDQLLRDRMPKGFIQVMGDVGQPQLDSIRRYWYAAMSGAGGAWNIPILPSGKDGVGIDFKTMGQSNRDMEYHKLMMFLSSVVASVTGMDLAELGIKADDSTAIIGESSKARVETSQKRWLRSQLAYLEQHLNKVIRKVSGEWKLKFTGIEREDEMQKEQMRKVALETRMTINEIREQVGDEPIDEPWANVILNPQAIQMIMAQMNQQMSEGAEGGEPGGEEGGEFNEDFQDPETWEPGDESDDDNEDEESPFNEDFEDPKEFMKSRRSGKEEKVIRIVVK